MNLVAEQRKLAAIIPCALVVENWFKEFRAKK